MIRRNTRLLLPMLALGLTLATAASVRAEVGTYPGSNGTSTTLQVNLGVTPHWTTISGSRVEELLPAERPGYDMFRLGGSYYAYSNNRWYRSTRGTGEFASIDDRSVPAEFAAISREHWLNYPSGWQERTETVMATTAPTMQFNYGAPRHWTTISGTRVDGVPATERPDYDLFRFGGNYYVYENSKWYLSPSETGDFAVIDDASVPPVLSSVPREHWRNYPAGWQDRQAQLPVAPPGTMQVAMVDKKHWKSIDGTRIKEIKKGERPDYDMFRYSGNYYVYDGTQWYSSRKSSGQFAVMAERSVPSQFSSIPRDHWRNYPAAWLDESGNPRSGKHR